MTYQPREPRCKQHFRIPELRASAAAPIRTPSQPKLRGPERLLGQLESDSIGPKVYNPAMAAKQNTLRFIGIFGTVLMSSLRGDAPVSSPPLPELISVLRTNLALGSTEFEAQASQALIERFGVRRLDAAPTTPSPNAAPIPSPIQDFVARRERLDGGILYLRMGRVSAGSPAALRNALSDTAWTTNATGLVLDLRFASGDSLPAAGESVALFSDRTESVLQWGSSSASGSGSQRLWSRPVAVLVNGRTEGSAEALAAALRQETGSALIGQPTAGIHGVFRDVTLKDGTQLQVPVGRIRLGDGSTLAEGPLTPDIRIAVTEKSERGFLENPTATLKANGVSGTNSSATTQRRKVTEADLVRAQRSEPTDAASETNAAPKTPVNLRLADPVLARAADLVRGLAAFQKAR